MDRDSSYAALIRLYFPPEEWARAECHMKAECGSMASCVRVVGSVDCGAGPRDSRAYGLFGLLDSCWDPAANPDSPFTPEQWAEVLNPNVNVWMASVIWSAYGWRAWTTCDGCASCDVAGAPIPNPRGPALAAAGGGRTGLGVTLSLAAALVGIILAAQLVGR